MSVSRWRNLDGNVVFDFSVHLPIALPTALAIYEMKDSTTQIQLCARA